MNEAWQVMGFTYLLSAIVAMFVAFLIHMLVLLIRRFGKAPQPETAAVAQDDAGEIALAIAVALQRQQKS